MLSALGVVDKVVCNAPMPGEDTPKAAGSRKPYFRWTNGRTNIDLGEGTGNDNSNGDDYQAKDDDNDAVVGEEPPAKKQRQTAKAGKRGKSRRRSRSESMDKVRRESLASIGSNGPCLSVDTSMAVTDASNTHTPLPGKPGVSSGGGGSSGAQVSRETAVAPVGTAQAVLRFHSSSQRQQQQQQHSSLRLAGLRERERMRQGESSQGPSTGVGTPVQPVHTQLESVRTKMAFEGTDARRMTL